MNKCDILPSSPFGTGECALASRKGAGTCGKRSGVMPAGCIVVLRSEQIDPFWSRTAQNCVVAKR